MDLGLTAARELEVPMPVATTTRDAIQTMIGHGYTDTDFGALLQMVAKAANLDIKSEDKKVSTGL